MSNDIRQKNLKNLGQYKSRIISNRNTSIDKNSLNKFESQLNKITDTLFISLSRGMRFPAIFSSKIYFDYTSNIWEYYNSPYSSLDFVKGVTPDITGNNLEYLDITINNNLISKTDITPLFFVNNVSETKNGFFNNQQVIFPRLDSYVQDSTSFIVKVAMEVTNGGSIGFYEIDSSNGDFGTTLFLEGLFQSTPENADKISYTVGIPYFEKISGYVSNDYIKILGNTYADIVPDGSHTPWLSKIRLRTQAWTGDCISGSGYGDYTYGSWESTYKKTNHIAYIYNLSPLTQYKIWVQIKSSVGPDNMDWTSVGCYTTSSPGGGGGEMGGLA